MYFPRFSVVKLTVLLDKIFLYVENELSTSTEVISTYFIVHTTSFKLQH